MAAGGRHGPRSPLQSRGSSISKRDTFTRLAEEIATANKQASAAPKTPTEDDVLRLALISSSSSWRPRSQGSFVVAASPTPGSGIDAAEEDKGLAPARERRLAEPRPQHAAAPLAGGAAVPRPPPLAAAPRAVDGVCAPAGASTPAGAAEAAEAVPPQTPPRTGEPRRSPAAGSPNGAGSAERRTPSFASNHNAGESPFRAQAPPAVGIRVPAPPQAASRLGSHSTPPLEPAEEIQRARQAHDRQLNEVRLQLDREQRRCRELLSEHQDFLQDIQSSRRLASEVEGLQSRLRERELEASRQESAIARCGEEAAAAGRRIFALREERAELDEQAQQLRGQAQAEEARVGLRVKAELNAHEVLELSLQQEREECATIARDSRERRAQLLLAEAEARRQGEAEARLEEELRAHQGAAARWRGEAEARAFRRREAESEAAGERRSALLRLEQELAQARASLEEREAQITEQRRENARLAAITRAAASRDGSGQAELGEALRETQELLGTAREELSGLKAHVRLLTSQGKRQPCPEGPSPPAAAADAGQAGGRRTPHFALSPADSPAGGLAASPCPPPAAEELGALRAELAGRLAAVLTEGDCAIEALRAEVEELQRQNRELQSRLGRAQGATAAPPAGPPPPPAWERLWEEVLAPLQESCRLEAQARDEAQQEVARCLSEASALEADVASGRAEAASLRARAAAAHAVVRGVAAEPPQGSSK